MFCKQCGEKNEDAVQFCKNCGIGIPEKIKIDNNELKFSFNKPSITKIIIGFLCLLFLYIILSDKPFSFVFKEENRVISQNILVGSVVNIICEDDNGEISGGSGTIITDDGIILTNSHVIPQDEEYILTGDTGCLVIIPNQQTGQPDEIYWANPVVIPELSDEYDLAYLEIYDVFVDEDNQIWGEYPKIFKSIFSDEFGHDDICEYDTDNLGDSIRVFGYPQSSGGFVLTITEGIISSFSDDGIILTSAKIDAGNSGGLAVDENGCMVGVPVAVSEGTYQNMGVIIPITFVLEFSNKLEELNNN
jgi:hypothetical protein